MARMPDAVLDIDRICALQDAVLRNLLITQRYADLSHGLRTTIDSSNANWSTFATWASKTAGQSIRGEEVPAAVLRLLNGADVIAEGISLVDRALSLLHVGASIGAPPFLASVHRTLRDLSDQIAVGNLAVFRELAPEFARFIASFEHDKSYDGERISQWTSRLRPGAVEEGGQELLRDAFSSYYQAKFERDAELRAQLLLYANCQIGLHEQTRLQPQIEGALDAPIEDLLASGIHEVAKTRVPEDKHHHIPATLAPPLGPVLSRVAAVWRRVATRHLMNLTLPLGQQLDLGQDVPPELGEPAFPAPLQRISAPPPLIELLARYDRASGSGTEGSRAIDWANIPDRMNFIINLFRSRQQDEELFDQPFDDQQRTSIESGLVPEGAL